MSTLPSGWAVEKFTTILDINGGTQPPKNEFISEPKEGYIRLLQIRDFGQKPVPTYIPDNGKRRTCKKEDILIGRYGASVGRICTGMEGAYNVALARVAKPNQIDTGFLKYFLKSHYFQQPLSLLSRSAQNGFNKQDLSEFDLLIPPLKEQIRIANKLDSLLAKVEAAQTRLEKIPTLLKRFRQSVLAAATSGELTKDWREGAAFGEVVNIGSLISDIRYGTSKKYNSEQDGTAVLRIPNIGENGIDTSDLKYANFDTREKEKLGLKRGDLLVIRSNGSVELVGKVAIVTDKDLDYLFAGYLIRLRFRDLSVVVPKYVLYSLQSPAVRSVVEINARSTSGINNINSKELASLEINLPSFKEQKEIVRRVESLFSLADSFEKQYTETKKRTDRLTQSLLAKAFRGELVPQDPNDESASELLKRIQAEREQHVTSKAKLKTAKGKAITTTTASGNARVITKRKDQKKSTIRDKYASVIDDACKDLKGRSFSIEQFRSVSGFSGDYETLKALILNLLNGIPEVSEPLLIIDSWDDKSGDYRLRVKESK